jgi:hypothetical protein
LRGESWKKTINSMKRRRLPADAKISVVLTTGEVADIRQHTFLGPELLLGGIVEANGSVRFRWSLEDIEEVLGHVAASANHTKNRKLEKRLDRISDKLQDIIDRF